MPKPVKPPIETSPVSPQLHHLTQDIVFNRVHHHLSPQPPQTSLASLSPTENMESSEYGYGDLEKYCLDGFRIYIERESDWCRFFIRFCFILALALVNAPHRIDPAHSNPSPVTHPHAVSSDAGSECESSLHNANDVNGCKCSTNHQPHSSMLTTRESPTGSITLDSVPAIGLTVPSALDGAYGLTADRVGLELNLRDTHLPGRTSVEVHLKDLEQVRL